MKRTLQIIVISFLVVFGTHAIVGGAKMIWDLNHEHTECGIVLSKISEDVSIKHGVSTTLILIVDWENMKKNYIKVSPMTYYEAKVGERVCLEFNDFKEPDSKFLLAEYTMGGIILVVGSVILFIIGLIKLFSE